MFDKFINVKGVSETCPRNITITELRAPTDDSIRLAEEYLEKAKKNLIGVYQIEGNVLSGVMFAFGHNVIPNTVTLYWKFILNAKEFVIQEDISYIDFKSLTSFDMNSKDLAKVLFTKVSEVIVNKLIEEFCKSPECKFGKY